jgi:tRNA G18 (ribose-2'-O)-methylase SpoU
MPQIEVADLDDPRIAVFRNLKQTNATRWAKTFVVEGDKLVARLLASSYPVESILAAKDCLECLPARISSDVPVYVLPGALVEQVVGFNFHRGLLACGRRQADRPLASVCGSAGALTLVVCVDVQDPENLGSILRSSAAFGVEGIVLAGRCADALSRRVLRVSMGAALSLPLVQAPDLPLAIELLRRDYAVKCWATALDDAAARLGAIQRPARLAILLGNEAHGLSAQWQRLCDDVVTIPMRRGTDSLNVAVAAGVFLYEICGRSPAESLPHKP